jgi:hypothetical protein
VSSRDRIVGAVFVLIVLAAQTFWMGPAIVLLSGGLVVAYVVWAAARWKDDRRRGASCLPVRPRRTVPAFHRRIRNRLSTSVSRIVWRRLEHGNRDEAHEQVYGDPEHHASEQRAIDQQGKLAAGGIVDGSGAERHQKIKGDTQQCRAHAP